MQWDGPWAKSRYEEQAPDLNYRAILSFEGPAGRVQGSYVWFWAISSGGDQAQKQASWDFCQWLSAPAQYAVQYRAIGLMPITNELPEEYLDDPWLQAFNENLEIARLYYSKYEKWEQVELLVSEELERFVLGEITAAEALQNGEEKVNELLAEG
jgi:ABC-type glycerol-3-phosphate transport system substrate-binding protein